MRAANETAPGDGSLLHRTRMRVPMSDTDGASLVYFAAPFRWSEHAFSEWMAERVRRPMRDLFQQGYAMPVVTTRAQFHEPLRQDDLVELLLSCPRIGRTSFVLHTAVATASLPTRVAIEVETVMVYVEDVHEAPQPQPLPAWLRGALSVAPEVRA